MLAYQKVAADETGACVPRSSITRAILEDLLALRNAVLDNRFKWGARLEIRILSYALECFMPLKLTQMLK